MLYETVENPARSRVTLPIIVSDKRLLGAEVLSVIVDELLFEGWEPNKMSDRASAVFDQAGTLEGAVSTQAEVLDVT